MSVSSGSDVTIPMQDSPPPPPSPYRGRTGIENSGFSVEKSTKSKSPSSHHSNNKRGSSGGGSSVEIQMENYSTPKVNEAVNGEIVNGMSPLDTIPQKPNKEFGPYDNLDTYFIPVNQHKKFLRRGEKLCVTKDKRDKSSKWKKYACWTFGILLITAIVTIAILAALGLFPQNRSGGTFSMIGMTTTSTIAPISESTSFSSLEESTTDGSPPNLSTSSTERALLDNYVSGADVQLVLQNGEFIDELNDAESSSYKTLANEIENLVVQKMEVEGNIGKAFARVVQFLPGSIVTKLKIGWVSLNMDFGEEVDSKTVQKTVSSWTNLGNYTIRPGTTIYYSLYNLCKLSNNGCSHTCEFNMEKLDFICTCPDDNILDESQKNCTKVPEPTIIPPMDESTQNILENTSSTTPSSATEISEIVTPIPTTENNQMSSTEAQNFESFTPNSEISQMTSTSTSPPLTTPQNIVSSEIHENIEILATTPASVSLNETEENNLPDETHNIANFTTPPSSTSQTNVQEEEMVHENDEVTTVAPPADKNNETFPSEILEDNQEVIHILTTTTPSSVTTISSIESSSPDEIQNSNEMPDTPVEVVNVEHNEELSSQIISTTTPAPATSPIPILTREIQENSDHEIRSILSEISREELNENSTQIPPIEDTPVTNLEVLAESSHENISHLNTTEENSSILNHHQSLESDSQSYELSGEGVTILPNSQENKSARESRTFFESADEGNSSSYENESLSLENEETTVRPMVLEREIEEMTTIKPISLINDTLVNNLTEGITEDSLNTESIEENKSADSEELTTMLPIIVEELNNNNNKSVLGRQDISEEYLESMEAMSSEHLPPADNLNSSTKTTTSSPITNLDSIPPTVLVNDSLSSNETSSQEVSNEQGSVPASSENENHNQLHP